MARVWWRGEMIWHSLLCTIKTRFTCLQRGLGWLMFRHCWLALSRAWRYIFFLIPLFIFAFVFGYYIKFWTLYSIGQTNLYLARFLVKAPLPSNKNFLNPNTYTNFFPQIHSNPHKTHTKCVFHSLPQSVAITKQSTSLHALYLVTLTTPTTLMVTITTATTMAVTTAIELHIPLLRGPLLVLWAELSRQGWAKAVIGAADQWWLSRGGAQFIGEGEYAWEELTGVSWDMICNTEIFGVGIGIGWVAFLDALWSALQDLWKGWMRSGHWGQG